MIKWRMKDEKDTEIKIRIWKEKGRVKKCIQYIV